MEKYSTPEERLLHLIRRKGAKQKEGDGLGLGGAASNYNFWLRPRKTFSSSFYLKFFNQLLIAAGALLVLFILFEFLFAPAAPTPAAKVAPKSSTEEKNLALETKEVKPYSYYAIQFGGRDIFAISQNEEEGNIEEPTETTTTIQDLAKDLRLVGVIMDNNPQAIIENKTDNKTYFLRQGELINDLKLESITENKVILSQGKEKLELSL